MVPNSRAFQQDSFLLYLHPASATSVPAIRHLPAPVTGVRIRAGYLCVAKEMLSLDEGHIWI